MMASNKDTEISWLRSEISRSLSLQIKAGTCEDAANFQIWPDSGTLSLDPVALATCEFGVVGNEGRGQP